MLRVDSIINFQHTYANGDELVTKSLIENPNPLTAEQLKKIKAIAVNEIPLLDSAIDKKGCVSAVGI